MPVYVYRCEEHGLFDLVVPYENRNESQTCEACGPGPLWPRTWEASAPVVNDSGSATIPEVAARGRFAGVRETRLLDKAAKKAKGSPEELKRVKEERKKLWRSF